MYNISLYHELNWISTFLFNFFDFCIWNNQNDAFGTSIVSYLYVYFCIITVYQNPDIQTMLDNHTRGLCLAVVAGVMAALASVSAKLAVTADVVHELCLTFTQSFETLKMSVVCDSVRRIY